MNQPLSKSEKTKARFADVIKDILLTGVPGKLSIKNIAEAAGVDRQTFYYHFGTLDDLLEYSYKRKLDALFSGSHDKENIRDLLGLIIGELEKDKAFFRVLIRTVEREILKKQLHDDVERVVSNQISMISKGKALNAKTRQYAVKYCIYATVSMIENWITGDLQMSPKELVAFLADSFEWYVAGLLAEKI